MWSFQWRLPAEGSIHKLYNGLHFYVMFVRMELFTALTHHRILSFLSLSLPTVSFALDSISTRNPQYLCHVIWILEFCHPLPPNLRERMSFSSKSMEWLNAYLFWCFHLTHFHFDKILNYEVQCFGRQT